MVAQAVEAVRKVDELIATNASDSRKIMDGVKNLAVLIDHYRTGTVVEMDATALTHE